MPSPYPSSTTAVNCWLLPGRHYNILYGFRHILTEDIVGFSPNAECTDFALLPWKLYVLPSWFRRILTTAVVWIFLHCRSDQPVARGQHVACDTMLRCLRRHMDWKESFKPFLAEPELESRRYLCLNTRIELWIRFAENVLNIAKTYPSFDVLLTAHLSIFISVINQINAQNFCFTVSLFHASNMFRAHVLETC